MVSKQYESKIDRIEARLANIERLLQERLRQTPQSSATPAWLQVPSDPVVEVDGYTGPHADSLAAKEAFEQVAGVSPAIASDESMRAALASLRGIIDRIKGEENDSSASGLHATNLALPTWEDVNPILHRIETQQAPNVKIFLPFLDPAGLRRKCTGLYENAQNGPIADRLLAYSCLGSLCAEFSGYTKGAESERNDSMAQSFRHHLLQTINVMPAIQTASYDGVEALSMAGFACLEMCRPQLAFTLTSIALRFCQTLGYNRLPLTESPNDPQRQRNIFMFWQAYMYDRNAALRVGRPPSIPEFDVSTEGLDPERLPRYAPAVTNLHRYWVQVADVQGAVSAKLYSPVGIRHTFEQRARLVKTLVAKLQSAWEHRKQINDGIEQICNEIDSNSLTAYCVRIGDEIFYFSTLTLVLHALSPAGQPTSDAIGAARACMRAYQEITSVGFDNIYAWIGFCHCVTLYTPLTPFTVLFTHVIHDHENGRVDLQLLNDFVESLKPARHVSNTIDRFHSLCSKFCQIAEAYVSAKSQEAVMTEFDNYLSTLGLLPQPISQGNGLEMDPIASSLPPHTYQDWYSGNVGLYGLIDQETDFANLDSHFELEQ